MTETPNDAATNPQQTIAELQRKLAERTAERDEALERQTATAEVLKVISRSAFDLQPALDTVAETAARLCNADSSAIFRREGALYRLGANFGFPPEYEAAWREAGAVPFDRESRAVGWRAVGELRPVHIHDVTADPSYLPGASRQAGGRTALGVPLMREGEAIGFFVLARKRVEPFSERQIELVETFADQAVIAIENVRLFDEVQARTEDLRESLQQQTATAEVLKVISRSAFDLQTVFDTLISSAIELCGAVSGTICVRDGDVFPYRATVGTTPEFAQFLAEHPAIPGRHSTAGRVILSGEVVCIPDILEDSEYRVPVVSFQIPTRSSLGVPLLRNDRLEGALVLVRTHPGDFDLRQIELLNGRL